MNLTLDQYINGFERTARELPELLGRWESIDHELREEYAEQLAWLLESRSEVHALAERASRGVEIAMRTALATAAIFSMRAALAQAMNLPSEAIVDVAVPAAPASGEDISCASDADVSCRAMAA